jgi:hypothetical protein
MEKSVVLKNLQKEVRTQEKLKEQISEKKTQLKQSKEKEVMYRKWYKKLNRLEEEKHRREKAIEEKMKGQIKNELLAETIDDSLAAKEEKGLDYTEGLFSLGSETYE